MIVECPGCTTIFPVDPNKVPDGGIHARCTVCNDVFFVSVEEPTPEETGSAAADPQAGAADPQVEQVIPQEEDAFGEPMVTLEDVPGEGGGAEDVPVDTDWDEDAPAQESFAEEAPDEDSWVEDAPVEAFQGSVEDSPAPGDEGAEVVETAPASEMDEPLEPATVEEEEPDESLPTPTFGRRDPKDKAQRLARVLVSDIILYNPDRHQSATEAGRVKEEFEEEIAKSWAEYVEQVGEDVANSTPFFTDALNEILARGESIF